MGKAALTPIPPRQTVPLPELDDIGRAMFGKASRLRIGIWIASLPGEPRTFSQAEYYEWLHEQGGPPCGPSIRSDLDRFASCNMVVERVDLNERSRVKAWTRLDSPLWDVFMLAGYVLGEHRLNLIEQRRHQLADLLVLRDDLRMAVAE